MRSISNSRALERAALTAGLTAFFVGGYFGVGLMQDPTRARELTTVLDEQIPFVAYSVWVYIWVFPAALIPLFVVRCTWLFHRTALAYAVVIAVSLICFAVFPVTSERLRVPSAMLNVAHPSDWAVSVLYALDPPYNLFPSLHLSIAALAALSAWRTARVYGAAAFVGVGFVGLAVCTVKQHFVLDVLGGFALAALAGALILGPCDAPGSDARAYSRRGPTMYLAFVALIYAGFYATYLWAS